MLNNVFTVSLPDNTAWINCIQYKLAFFFAGWTIFQPSVFIYTFGHRICLQPVTVAILNISHELENNCIYRDYRVDFRGITYKYNSGFYVSEAKLMEETIRYFNPSSTSLRWTIRGMGNSTGKNTIRFTHYILKYEVRFVRYSLEVLSTSAMLLL